MTRVTADMAVSLDLVGAGRDQSAVERRSVVGFHGDAATSSSESVEDTTYLGISL